MQVNALVNRRGGGTVTGYMQCTSGGEWAFAGAQTSVAENTQSVAGVAVQFPRHLNSQEDAIAALTGFAGPEFGRFALSSGVESRHTALPLSRYADSSGFSEANAAFIGVALDLRAFPDQVGVLLAVELCSLTIQREDSSVASLVASSLFGDGAAAVVATGAHRATQGPGVLATRSPIYPDTVMGWNIGSDGFRTVLSADVATVADPPPVGSIGLMIAMGPAFCSELVLPRW